MIESYLEFGKRIAKEAGLILKERFGKVEDVDYKGAVNLVTEADFVSQDFTKKEINRNFPEHGILSEENLEENSSSNFRWIIDPLDGTTNYAHNFPIFSVSIALEENKEIVLGVVYNPILDELFWAEKGKGAYLNGSRIKVSSVSSLSESLLATGFPYDIRESDENNLNYFSKFALRAQAIRRCGSAALDMCYVGCGRFDGYWEIKLSPWDVAAGILIVKEADGMVSDFNGSEIDMYSKEVLASNGKIHSQMIQIFKDTK
ncbi:MAG: inositol monophosphatase family protein [Acidobacteriota bacterium]